MTRVLLSLVFVVACKRDQPPPPAPPPTPIADASVAVVDAAPPPPFRTPTSTYGVDPKLAGTGKTFMVVTENADASKVGRDVLAAGGNAVDAAVATAFALAVVYPQAGNLGGGGFAVVRTGPGKVTTLDFREVAPKAATQDMFLDQDGKPTQDSLQSHRASGVPGSVAGLHALHAKYGKRPWKALLEPAIALARNGFALSTQQARALASVANILAKHPASAAIWLPDGPVRAGATVKIPDLAKTLERIRDKGPVDFYKGETARLIVDEMQRGKGLVTREDLAAYQVAWREPIAFTYRGHKLYSMAPPSSGGVVLALTANILGRVDLKALGWHSAEHVRWLAETWRRGFAARNEMLGDPAFVKNPIERLTSMAFADKLAATIGPKATPSKDVGVLLEGTDTTNLVVVDGKGLAVALTTTINTSFGSGVTVTGAGFLLNNEMDDFTVKPGHPNAFGLVQGTTNKIEPGKRMLSSMAPTLVESPNGELYAAVGARGGARIITAVWQSLSNVIDFGMPVEAAIAAPRVHHQHLPDKLQLQADSVDEPNDKTLRAMGYEVDWSSPGFYFAAAQMIVKTEGGYRGAADPRTDGAALGD